MKVKKICLGIALAMSLVACNNEEYTINSKESKLEASVESAIDSRVGFDKTNNWAFYWHNGDQIWVNGSPMTTSAEDKSKTATFTGYGVNTNSGYAVYPYNQNLYQIDGTSLTWNFPDTYDYTSVDNDFFKSAQAIPMYAKVENGSAHFYHMGAIVAIKLNDWKFTGDHVFTLKTSKKITGEFSTDLSSGPKFETTTAEEDVVIINYTRPSDATTASVVFYVPVPVGNYDIEVAVAVDEITYFNKSYTGVNVAVGDIVWAEYGESTLDGSDGSNKTVASVGEIDEEILSSESEDLTVNVTSEVTGTDNTIKIPTTLNTNTTTFSFASVAEGAKITIQNEDGGAYDGQVIIEVPVGATIPEVEAKIPDGEVYIKQGNVTTLVVASAENTTIIGAGVEVGTLTVMKGNVRIENGGKVGAINRSTGNTKTVYVIYESITAPNITVGEGVVLVSAAEWDLRKAIEMGGTVILTENLNLNSPIEITKGNATLDLNGKTITAANGDAIVVSNNAELTITGNGVVKVAAGANGCAVWAHHGGKVTIENGTFSTNDDAEGDRCDCIYAGSTADMSAGTITIKDGTFKYDGANQDGHKFLLNKKDNTSSSITVYGGTFHKFNPAISYGEPNAPVDFVAEGSIVVETSEGVFEVLPSVNNVITLSKDVAVNSPIEITKGNVTLDLNGKTITAANGDAIVVSNNAELTITGNGVVKVAAGANGCAVWAHHGGKVTIENGTFSTNDDAEGDRCDCIYAGSTADMSAGTITIKDGTFKYDGANQDGHKFLLNKKDNTSSSITVYGGTFHKFNPAISYGEPNAPVDFVAEGSIVVETSEGVFEVLPSVNNVITLSKDVAVNSPIEITKGNVILDLNGKTITAANGDAIVVSNNAELTITGNGIVKVEKGANGCAVWAHHGGKVTIENGTFSTNDDVDGDRCDCIYAGSTADMSAGTITINGGTFKYDGENEEGHKFLLNKKDNTASAIIVYGGVFHKFNPAISYGEPNAPVDFVAGGSIVVETSEGVFEVLSSVNNVVTLSKDVAVNSPIEITKGNVTLDLNGKTITAANGDAIVVSNNAELTITGNGIVKVEKGANGCAVWAHHGGKVTIENGTFSTNDDAEGDRCDCIYAGSTADMSAGTITIKGGTFKYDGANQDGHKFLLNKKDNTSSSITVYGGTFYKFNPAISYGEPDAPVNFVAEGYKSIQEGDYYIVKQ